MDKKLKQLEEESILLGASTSLCIEMVTTKLRNHKCSIGYTENHFNLNQPLLKTNSTKLYHTMHQGKTCIMNNIIVQIQM